MGQQNKTQHHSRSMSKWPAILECACFESAPATANTEKGTACHLILEDALKTWNSTGKLPELDDLDMFEAGAMRAARVITEDAAAHGVIQVHSEAFVELPSGVRGIADAYFIADGEVFLYDFKTFRNVSRDYTAQLAGYGLAIAKKNNAVHMTVLYGDSNEQTRSHLSYPELEAYERSAMCAFDAHDEGTAQPHQCNWCNLCKHCASCPACTTVIEKTGTTLASAAKPEEWATLPTKKKAQLLVLAEFAAQWADIVKDNAKADLLAGETINDEELGVAYKLQTVRGRQTPDTAKACEMLQENGVDRGTLASKLKLSPADIKALLAGAGVKGKEAATLVDSVCTRGAETVKMVKE